MKTTRRLMAFAFAGIVAASTPASALALPFVSSDRGPSYVVQGTIRGTNATGTEIVLKDGTRLIVPLTVNIPRALLTAPHSVKAYYVRTPEGNVVTQMEVLALQPGSGGSNSG
ncbi:MAG TPA: hypothetical protein VJU81_17205 [Methylomirabilota bacterium]|nr:hypothetical protein [Methylomirabilota bacterium]